MRETENKIEDIRCDMKDIKESLSELKEFKIQMLASARMTSLLVSIVCGVITLAVSVWAASHAK
jgi:hypothetical protein